jgi:Acyl-CoA hydrolase
MLNFLVDIGMLSAMKVAKGLAVLASLDDVIFKKPILLGDIITVEAETDYVGNTSMEVSMRAVKGDETLVEATGVTLKWTTYSDQQLLIRKYNLIMRKRRKSTKLHWREGKAEKLTRLQGIT